MRKTKSTKSNSIGPAAPLHAETSTRLEPNHIVRLKDGHRYFGLKQTQLEEKIIAGELPEPIKLSDSGRARGWLGSQILDWQQRRLAESEAHRANRAKEA
jgi:predicted DNA-binding transcriptional regulator AlpA